MPPPDRKFVDTDADWIPELQIECPACKAQPGNWCVPPEGGGLGLHSARITQYVWFDKHGTPRAF